MSARRRMALWARALFGTPAVDRELDEEIRLHLDLETDRNIRAGMAPAEARRRARIAFGGVEATKEAHRDARGVRWLEDALADGRHALRAFRRSPVLVTAAVVTLAVGIGANTAIFSAVNAVILRPLPYPNADRLVSLGEDNAEYGWRHAQVAPANMLDWREQVPAFADVAGYVDYGTTTTLTGEGEPRLLVSSEVTGNLFAVLGVRAQLGRTLRPEETWQTGVPVAVLSDRLWREQFGGDPAVVGRTVVLDDTRVRIVGVMPTAFRFPVENVDLWVPTAWDPADRERPFFRRAHWTGAVARLKPGISPDQANAQLQTVVRRLQQQYPATNRVMGADMQPLHESIVGNTRQPLLVLLGAVALLLLIACANVANLLLVHAAGREREAALRLALGAGRGRLVRQALTESLVLSTVGGAAGLALAFWGTRVLTVLQPPGMLPVHDLGMDWAVLGYVSLLGLGTGLLFGIAPAMWNSRRLPADALKEGGRGGGAGTRMRRWGDALVIVEVALALVLTVGAGLLVRSFRQLEHVDGGFDGSGVLAVTLGLPSSRYDTGDKITAFWDGLVQRARALPGVDAAAATARPPLSAAGWTSDFSVAGRAADAYGVNVSHREVTPGYFTLMRVPLLRGRVLTDQDRRGAPMVVLINASLARRYFANEDPLGKRITFDRVPDSTSVWRTIVGVVGDEHQTSLATQPRIEIIAPVAQDLRLGMTLLLRTSGDPLALAPAARRLVADLDPKLAIESVKTMDTVRRESLATQRFLMTLLLGFAGAGLLLAIVGVYGIMAQVANGRTREIGIRMALGARASVVRWLVVRHGLRLAAVGLALGIAGALLGTRAMRTLLYAVTPADPVTFLVVPVLLIVTAAVASWLPAVRASQVDPITVLRVE
jgi:putative ABC transport system permease protein